MIFVRLSAKEITNQKSVIEQFQFLGIKIPLYVYAECDVFPSYMALKVY